MSRHVSATCRLAAAMVAMALAAGLSLTGCDSADTQAAAATSTSTPASPRVTAASEADMVAAVSGSRESGLVDLKFRVTRRPALGEPLDIEFAITPAGELEHLFARFQVTEGLQLVSGGETEHLDNPAPRVPVGHKVTIIPRTDGVFAITAVVLADSDTESVARTFSIPIIAGQGMSEPPAPPAAASVADSKHASARP